MKKHLIKTVAERDQLIAPLKTEKDLQDFVKKYSFATPYKVTIRKKLAGTYTDDIIDKYLPIKERQKQEKSGLESAFADAVKGLSAEVKKALKSDLDTLIAKIDAEQDKQAKLDTVNGLSIEELEALVKAKKEAQKTKGVIFPPAPIITKDTAPKQEAPKVIRGMPVYPEKSMPIKPKK